MTRPIVCLMSGGIDSAVMAHRFLMSDKDTHIIPVFCMYGQCMESQEEHSVHLVTTALRYRFKRIQDPLYLRIGIMGRSRILEDHNLSKDDPFPYGEAHPAYVPGRDPLLALHVASVIECYPNWDVIAIGVHKTDQNNRFPDCNEETWEAVNRLLQVSMSRKNIHVITPLMAWTKQDVHAYANEYWPELKEIAFSGYGDALER